MKRTLLAIITTALLAITASATYAADYDLKTPQGIEKFWRAQADERSAGGGGGN